MELGCKYHILPHCITSSTKYSWKLRKSFGLEMKRIEINIIIIVPKNYSKFNQYNIQNLPGKSDIWIKSLTFIIFDQVE